MFTSIKITKDRELLLLRRDREPKLVHHDEKTLLSGSKFYYDVLFDGTVIAGWYTSKGAWRPATAEIINDIFDLRENERLWNGRIEVNSREAFLLLSAYDNLATQYNFAEKYRELELSSQFELELKEEKSYGKCE